MKTLVKTKFGTTKKGTPIISFCFNDKTKDTFFLTEESLFLLLDYLRDVFHLETTTYDEKTGEEISKTLKQCMSEAIGKSI